MGVVEVVTAEITLCPSIRRGQVAVAARRGAEEAAASEVTEAAVAEAEAGVVRVMWKSSGMIPTLTM